MKHLGWLLAMALAVTVARAQTGASATGTNKPTEIISDSADFNLKSQAVTYRGHVRVTDPQMNLSCDVMVVRTATEGGHIESIVAEGNVVVDIVNPQGETNHAMGKKLVYTYKVENSVTNDQAVLTGDPRVEQGGNLMTGKAISWDRATGNMYVTEPHVISQSGIMSGTSQSQTVTNEPAPAVQ